MLDIDSLLPNVVVSHFLAKAYTLASFSKDQSNQNGALLVDPITEDIIGEGVNNFPEGVVWNEERANTRPDKYLFYEHAERWAVYDAAKRGNSSVDGAHMVCPFACCCDCARSIIVSGVSVLYVHKQRMKMVPDRWMDSINIAHGMLEEAGVHIEYYDGSIASVSVLVNGSPWHPMDQPIEFLGNWAVSMEG